MFKVITILANWNNTQAYYKLFLTIDSLRLTTLKTKTRVVCQSRDTNNSFTVTSPSVVGLANFLPGDNCVKVKLRL